MITDKIIAVDFDNTLTSYSEYPITGKILDDVVEQLKIFQSNNNKLILWTCREDEELEEAIKLCAEKGLIFDAINDNIDTTHNSRKVYADIYVDDKNISLQTLITLMRRW